MSDVTGIAFASLFVEAAAEKYTDDTFRAHALTLTPAGKKELYDGLIAYIHAYTGTFVPVVSVRAFLVQNTDAKLTLPQCRMIANTLRVEVQQSARQRDLDSLFPVEPVRSTKAPVPDVPVAELAPDGYYTVVFKDGARITLRIKHWSKPGKPEWLQIASVLVGPENTADYRGIAFLEGRQITWWRSFASVQSNTYKALHYLVGGEDGNWREAGVAYARASRKCFVCNRELTDPLSIELGIGPVCRDAVGF